MIIIISFSKNRHTKTVERAETKGNYYPSNSYVRGYLPPLLAACAPRIPCRWLSFMHGVPASALFPILLSKCPNDPCDPAAEATVALFAFSEFCSLQSFSLSDNFCVLLEITNQ